MMGSLFFFFSYPNRSASFFATQPFWENGLWSGRTYLALAFAIHAFRLNASWKFGVHTSYPYIPNIGTLADIQTSRTLEGVEDVQGLGKYLESSASDHYLLVPYEHWLKG
jgi:hypothetical protein